jgi:hypothetical protein
MFRHTTILVLTSQTRLEIAIGQVEGTTLNGTQSRSRPSALNGPWPHSCPRRETPRLSQSCQTRLLKLLGNHYFRLR